MISVLMVAEKPSICTSIAQALSNGDMKTRGKCPPVHEFEGMFKGKAAFFRVTSVTGNIMSSSFRIYFFMSVIYVVVGHIFSLDFPKSYSNWDSVDPIDLFEAPGKFLIAS